MTSYRFGVFEFDGESLELRRGGRKVTLAPQPARLLALLLARPGAVVPFEVSAGEPHLAAIAQVLTEATTGCLATCADGAFDVSSRMSVEPLRGEARTLALRITASSTTHSQVSTLPCQAWVTYCIPAESSAALSAPPVTRERRPICRSAVAQRHGSS